MPAKDDRADDVEDRSDDNSAEFAVLAAMHSVLRGAVAVPVESPTGPSAFSSVLDDASAFCFRMLHYSTAPAVQHQARRCLRVLSFVRLGEVCDLFIKRMRTVKKDDDEREFASYMRALGSVRFGLTSAQNQSCTVNFVGLLTAFLASRSRGVLKKEACQAIESLVLQTLCPQAISPLMLARLGMDDGLVETAAERAERASFLNSPANARQFWQRYEALLDVLFKWVKTAKHAHFVLPVLTLLVAKAAPDLWAARAPHLGKLLISAIKDKALRLAGLELAARLWRETDRATFFAGSAGSAAAGRLASALASVIYEKKKSPKPEQEPLLEAYMKALCACAPDVAMEHILAVLRAPGYTAELRATALRAIPATALAGASDAIASYSSDLVPFLETVILAEDFLTREHTLLIAVVACFPHVLSSRPKLAVDTARRIALLAGQDDRELRTAALVSVQAHVVRAPALFALPCLAIFTAALTEFDRLHDEALLRAFKSLQLLLDTLAGLAETGVLGGSGSPSLPADELARACDAIEGACLIWWAHSESWVRVEAAKLLEVCAHPALRKLASPPTGARAWLVDALATASQADDAAAAADALVRVLHAEWDRYAGAIVVGWTKLVTAPHWFLPRNEPALRIAAALPAWQTHMRWLCAGVRSGSAGLSVSLVGEFLALLAELIFAPQPEFRAVLLACVATIDTSCLDELITRADRALLAVTGDKARSRQGRHAEPNVLWAHPYVLDRERAR